MRSGRELMLAWRHRPVRTGPARRRRDGRRGTVAFEYGLLSGLVAVGVTVGAGKLGVSLNRTFMDLAAKVLF